MTRSTETITEDLDKILATLQGLRTGFKLQRPLVEMKLGAPAAQLVDRVVNQVIDVHETIALVLCDLHEDRKACIEDARAIHERFKELEIAQAKIADGVRDSLRVLT